MRTSMEFCWLFICLCLLPAVAGQALFAFEYEKDRRYLITTHIGERVIGEFMEETYEFIFVDNLYSLSFLKIDKNHIKAVELLDDNVDLLESNFAAATGFQPQFSLTGDLGIPMGDAAAFLKAGYFARADMNFILPFSFLQGSPLEWRFGINGGYGLFNAQGNTFAGKLTAIPVVGYIRLKLDNIRFFLNPYASIGSGVTFSGMTKTINATGVNLSESSADLTLTGTLGAEAMLGRHIALFLELSSFTIFEGMNGMFLKINFGTGYRI